MNEEELERLGIGARGWGGSAGAMADTWKKTSDYISNFLGPWDTSDWGDAYEPGWEYKSNPEMLRDILVDNEEIIANLAQGGASAILDSAPLNMLSILTLLDKYGPEYLRDLGFTPEAPDLGDRGYESGGDVPIPEYIPWEMKEEYKPPLTPREEWARMYPDGGTEYIYPGDQYGNVKPLISGIGATKPGGVALAGTGVTGAEGNPHLNPIADYSKLKSPYPNALSLYAVGTGIPQYVGEPGYENLLGLETAPDPEVHGDAAYHAWFPEQRADLEAQLQREYQEELRKSREDFDRRNTEEERRHREEYNKMVADMLAEQELEASMDTDFSMGDLGQESGWKFPTENPFDAFKDAELTPTGELFKMLGDYFIKSQLHSQDVATPAESTPPSWLTVD